MSAPSPAIPLAIARDHPCYEGHFPGRPILPGVVLLGEVFAALEREDGFDPVAFTLTHAKFLRTVAPGEALTVHVARAAGGSLRFEVRAGGATVASGSLAPRTTGRAA